MQRLTTFNRKALHVARLSNKRNRFLCARSLREMGNTPKVAGKCMVHVSDGRSEPALLSVHQGDGELQSGPGLLCTLLHLSLPATCAEIDRDTSNKVLSLT